MSLDFIFFYTLSEKKGNKVTFPLKASHIKASHVTSPGNIWVTCYLLLLHQVTLEVACLLASMVFVTLLPIFKTKLPKKNYSKI